MGGVRPGQTKTNSSSSSFELQRRTRGSYINSAADGAAAADVTRARYLHPSDRPLTLSTGHQLSFTPWRQKCVARLFVNRKCALMAEPRPCSSPSTSVWDSSNSYYFILPRHLRHLCSTGPLLRSDVSTKVMNSLKVDNLRLKSQPSSWQLVSFSCRFLYSETQLTSNLHWRKVLGFWKDPPDNEQVTCTRQPCSSLKIFEPVCALRGLLVSVWLLVPETQAEVSISSLRPQNSC